MSAASAPTLLSVLCPTQPCSLIPYLGSAVTKPSLPAGTALLHPPVPPLYSPRPHNQRVGYQFVSSVQASPHLQLIHLAKLVSMRYKLCHPCLRGKTLLRILVSGWYRIRMVWLVPASCTTLVGAMVRPGLVDNTSLLLRHLDSIVTRDSSKIYYYQRLDSITID